MSYPDLDPRYQNATVARSGGLSQSPALSAATLMPVILAAVQNPAVDVDKFRELTAMLNQQEDRHAAREYTRAMREVSAILKPIVRDAENKETHSRYALLETIDDLIRPVYSEHGFSLRFIPQKPDIPGQVRVVCICSHEAGHSETGELETALDTTGIKGSTNKTPMHGLGSALTYLQRYLTRGFFNVILRNEDDDGNAGGGTLDRNQRRPPATDRREKHPPQEDVAEPSPFFKKADAALCGEKNGTQALKLLFGFLREVPTLDDLAALAGHPFVRYAQAQFPPMLRTQIDDALNAASARLNPTWNGNGKGHHAPETEPPETVSTLAADVGKALKADESESQEDDQADFPGDRT